MEEPSVGRPGLFPDGWCHGTICQAAWYQLRATAVVLGQGPDSGVASLGRLRVVSLREKKWWGDGLVPSPHCFAHFPACRAARAGRLDSSCLGHQRGRPRVTPRVSPPPPGRGESTIRGRTSLFRLSPALSPPWPWDLRHAISTWILVARRGPLLVHQNSVLVHPNTFWCT